METCGLWHNADGQKVGGKAVDGQANRFNDLINIVFGGVNTAIRDDPVRPLSQLGHCTAHGLGGGGNFA